jgi:archaellum component FlaC
MDIERELSDLQRLIRDLQVSVAALTTKSNALNSEVLSIADGTRRRLDTLNAQVWALRDDMPLLLQDALQRRRAD